MLTKTNFLLLLLSRQVRPLGRTAMTGIVPTGIWIKIRLDQQFEIPKIFICYQQRYNVKINYNINYG